MLAVYIASFFVVLLHFQFDAVDGLIHHLNIRKDDRHTFKIETFGFVNGGVIDLTVTDFSISKNSAEKKAELDAAHPSSTDEPNQQEQEEKKVAEVSDETVPATTTASEAVEKRSLFAAAVAPPVYRTGLLMKKVASESAAQQELERLMEHNICILDHVGDNDIFLDLSDQNIWKNRNNLVYQISRDKSVGLYSLIFTRCSPTGPHKVSFTLDAKFYNPGPDYLDAGDSQLPAMYFAFFVLFSAAMGMWCYTLVTTGGQVHHIHYMMLMLLGLKCVSLLSESIRYHYIAINGQSEYWSIIYYIFAFLKGITLFMVILLIGSGWSLMKSYLNDKEKKMVLFVLVLQVLDNIAMIVLEEMAPGSQGFLTWRDILHLVDIICCCAIMMPIVWSIRHLRLAAEVDGKAKNNLQKLQLFRQFYVMVVIYIYFTRIIVYLLEATIPFNLMWMGPCATETAALVFYVITGYKFRPAVDNPYLPVASEDNEGSEYGLKEEDDYEVEIQQVRV